MKKLILTVAAGTALALSSCNNGGDNQKLIDADNQAVQAMVDDRMKAMATDADAKCTAAVDSAAKVKFEEWEKEHAHHGTPHNPQHKDTKPHNPKDDKMQGKDNAAKKNLSEKDAKMQGKAPASNLSDKEKKMRGL